MRMPDFGRPKIMWGDDSAIKHTDKGICFVPGWRAVIRKTDDSEDRIVAVVRPLDTCGRWAYLEIYLVERPDPLIFSGQVPARKVNEIVAGKAAKALGCTVDQLRSCPPEQAYCLRCHQDIPSPALHALLGCPAKESQSE